MDYAHFPTMTSDDLSIDLNVVMSALAEKFPDLDPLTTTPSFPPFDHPDQDPTFDPKVLEVMSILSKEYPNLNPPVRAATVTPVTPPQVDLSARETTVDYTRVPSPVTPASQGGALSPCIEDSPAKAPSACNDSGYLSTVATPSPQAAQPQKEQLQPPSESYVTMIGKAMMSFPEREMVLGDLYTYLTETYPYLRTAKSSWKSTVRHNLSVCPCFVRGRKARQGRGYLWGVHPAYMQNFEKGLFTIRAAKRAAMNHSRRRGGSKSSKENVRRQTATPATGIDAYIPQQPCQAPSTANPSTNTQQQILQPKMFPAQTTANTASHLQPSVQAPLYQAQPTATASNADQLQYHQWYQTQATATQSQQYHQQRYPPQSIIATPQPYQQQNVQPFRQPQHPSSVLHTSTPQYPLPHPPMPSWSTMDRGENYSMEESCQRLMDFCA
ncbi:hypothetical protein CAPTEDRAFT_207452 [Capitella teleta]|uniref:Fork-head domain-containing protein n=1 Tax=Capitella teleta TaxID=283909 RepID=R7TM48_CAPTE|nr:hypothetical protein CAPTEDRAFT_207452 [Capitella teleta]|eukprot:ELT94607.1 hypothetical protein CAPTEDRAFT_207452 [Capitella teleta]